MKPIINKLLFISMLLWTVCPEVFAQNDSVVNSNPVHRQSAPTNRFPKAKIEGERKDSVSIISIVVDSASRKIWLKLDADADSMGHLFKNKKRDKYVLMPTKKYVQIVNGKQKGTKFKVEGRRFVDGERQWGKEITDPQNQEYQHSILLLNDYLNGGERECKTIDDSLHLWITSPVKTENGYMELLLEMADSTKTINMTTDVAKIPAIAGKLSAVTIKASPISLWEIKSDGSYQWKNPTFDEDGNIIHCMQQPFQANDGDTITIKYQTPQDFVDGCVSEFHLIIGGDSVSLNKGKHISDWYLHWWVWLIFGFIVVLAFILCHRNHLPKHKGEDDVSSGLSENNSGPERGNIPDVETTEEEEQTPNSKQPMPDMNSLEDLKQRIQALQEENGNQKEQLRIISKQFELSLDSQSEDIEVICKKRIEALLREGETMREQQLQGFIKDALRLDENSQIVWDELKSKIDILIAKSPDLVKVKDYLKAFFENHNKTSVPKDILEQMGAMDRIAQEEGKSAALGQLEPLTEENSKLKNAKLNAERILKDCVAKLKEALNNKGVDLAGAVNPDFPENGVTNLVNTIRTIELAKDAEEEKKRLNGIIEDQRNQIQQFPIRLETEKTAAAEAEAKKWEIKLGIEIANHQVTIASLSQKIAMAEAEVVRLKAEVSKKRDQLIAQLQQRIVSMDALITDMNGKFVRNGNAGEVLEGLLKNLTQSFSGFKSKFEEAQQNTWTQAGIMCNQVEKDVANLTISEMTTIGWINIVEQLKAYSDVEELYALFKECALSTATLTELDAEVRGFLGMLGYALLVPRLQVDTFNKKDFDYNNSGNLTIKMLAPDIKPAIGKVFELLQVGYICVTDGTRQNPQVVYSL